MQKIEMEVKHDDLSLEMRESLESKLKNSSYSIKLVVEYEEPVPDDWTPIDVAEFVFSDTSNSAGLPGMAFLLCKFIANKVAQLEKERCIKEFKHYIDQYKTKPQSLCGEVVAIEHINSCLDWMKTHNEFNYPRLKRDGDEKS